VPAGTSGQTRVNFWGMKEGEQGIRGYNRVGMAEGGTVTKRKPRESGCHRRRSRVIKNFE